MKIKPEAENGNKTKMIIENNNAETKNNIIEVSVFIIRLFFWTGSYF